jgi:hypothetical protein
MQFSLINESFTVGTVFVVDWDNHCMRCESNGLVYNNTRDLEIAIKIGSAEPCSDNAENQMEYQRMQDIAIAAKKSATKKAAESRESKDQQIRNSISRSDQDIIESIDISHTRKVKPNTEESIKVTPTSEVSISKPTPERRAMDIHYSDGAQEGQTVRSSNSPLMREEVQSRVASGKPLSPVLSGQKNWDVSKSGSIQNEINQKLNDSSIVVDENGQQYIRGLPVIRDDSEMGGAGTSLNQGMTTTLSPEQRAERAQKIQHIRSARQNEVSKAREKSGLNVQDNTIINNVSSNTQNNSSNTEENVQSMMPQNVEAGMGISDEGVTPVEVIKVPLKTEEKKNSTAGKLLKKRRK